jgi:hypothetical protein
MEGNGPDWCRVSGSGEAGEKSRLIHVKKSGIEDII